MAARTVGAIASSGSHHSCSVATRSVSASCGHAGLEPLEPRHPVGLVAAQVGVLVVEDRARRRRRRTGGATSRSSGVTSIVVPGMARIAAVAGSGQAVEERPLVAEDARLVAVDDVEVEQLGVEEARRPGARHDGAGADRLDVAHRPGQLALDLGVARAAAARRRAARRPSGTRSPRCTAASAGRRGRGRAARRGRSCGSRSGRRCAPRRR